MLERDGRNGALSAWQIFLFPVLDRIFSVPMMRMPVAFYGHPCIHDSFCHFRYSFSDSGQRLLCCSRIRRSERTPQHDPGNGGERQQGGCSSA